MSEKVSWTHSIWCRSDRTCFKGLMDDTKKLNVSGFKDSYCDAVMDIDLFVVRRLRITCSGYSEFRIEAVKWLFRR